MKYELRKYQQEAVDSVTSSNFKNGIIVIPCGCGKTIILSAIAKYYKTEHILILQPTKELLEQNYEKYQAISDCDNYSIYSASFNSKEISRVVFATIGSIKDYKLFAHFKIIIIDESHVVSTTGLYAPLIDFIKPDKLIGLTATPYRMSTKYGIEYKMLTRTREKIFDNVVYIYQNSQAMRDGYWANLRWPRLPHKYTREDLTIKRGDFVESEIERKNIQLQLHQKIALQILASDNKHILVFLTTIKECEILSELLKQYGVTSAAVSSRSTKKEREYILTNFKNGNIRVAINVGVLTCLSTDTEILTQNGWVNMDTVNNNSLIAQYDHDNGQIDFCNPLRIIKKTKNVGEEMVQLNGRYTSFNVTSDHNMLIAKTLRDGKIGPIIKIKAADIVNKKYHLPVSGDALPQHIIINQKNNRGKVKFMSSNTYNYRKKGMSKIEAKKLAEFFWERKNLLKYKSPHELSLSECRLIGFWLGDGTKRTIKNNGTKYSLCQSFKNPKMVDWVDNMLKSCNIDYNKIIYDAPKNNIILGQKCNVSGYAVFNLPIGTGGDKQMRNGLYKILPYLVKDGTDLYWGLNKEQYFALMEGFWYANGNHGNCLPYVGGKTVSSSKILLDLLQSIGVCRGFRTTVKPIKLNKNNKKQLYNISLYNKKLHQMVNHKPRKIVLNSETKVWCVQVPKGNIVTRHNGCVTIMGNCGFDFPALDCVILARPTFSLGLFYQMVGRGTRPHPSKEATDVYDFCGNVDYFGKIEEFELVGESKMLGLKCGDKFLIRPPSSYFKALSAEQDTISFGKYCGQKIQDVPIDYIRYCVQNFESFADKQMFMDFLINNK